MNTEMHKRIRQTKEGIWIIDGDSHISVWTEEQGRLDTDRTVDRICELIPVGGVVIDGGASIGDHTIAYARKVGPTGHVFAFEPNPAPFCCLTMNMAPYPWVHPLRMALMDEAGLVDFVVEPENVGMSRVATINEKHDCKVLAMVPPAEWFARLDFIKLDLEGGEETAWSGLLSLLIYDYRPIVMIEINRKLVSEDRVESLLNDVRSEGYTFRNFDPTKPDDLSGTQFDLLCTPK